jgi:hypothetical protein
MAKWTLPKEPDPTNLPFIHAPGRGDEHSSFPPMISSSLFSKINADILDWAQKNPIQNMQVLGDVFSIYLNACRIT